MKPCKECVPMAEVKTELRWLKTVLYVSVGQGSVLLMGLLALVVGS